MKKLRKKIVLGVFMSTTVVFALTVLIMGMAFHARLARQADQMTDILIKNNGTMPSVSELHKLEPSQRPIDFSFEKESLYRLRYFSVKFSGDSATCDLSHVATVNEDTAVKMANKAKAGGKELGYIDDFRFRVSNDGTLVVFLDYSNELSGIGQIVVLLIIVSAFFVATITLLFWFLSKRIVRPFEENSRMQKQFITDASHELKTPLAIISANAEVLAYKDGENEWINNITSQVKRISELVNELLALNRLEEVEEIADIEPVDLSQKVNEIADTFEQVFAGKNAELVREIQPDVILNCNPAQLERLVSVLIENSSKYVSDNGEVRITLRKDMRHTYLTIFNTCETDPDTDYSHLFDRFYRPDSSRTSKTGGHGVGLSIAKRIVTLHNGTIEAVPADDGLAFRVRLSNRLKPKTTHKR
jgi:signal transduction histidine kinase